MLLVCQYHNNMSLQTARSTLHRRKVKTQLYSTFMPIPSTLIRNENGDFLQLSLKTLVSHFSVNGKHFENEAFRES